MRTAHIRVYADDDYRGQNARWQQTFGEVLDDANEVLVGDYGVRLVADFRTWDRHVPGAPLADGLAALAALDPGDDVLTVVGLTSSMPLTSGDFEQLGYGDVPGRHLIVRGYADIEERKAFDRAFTDVSDDEREALYVARRKHRNATLLLHELGHNLGAPHAGAPDTIMSAVYSTSAASFDPDSRALILTALDARLRAREAPRPSAYMMRVVPSPRAASSALVIGVDRHGDRITGGNVLDDATLDQLFAIAMQDDPDTEIEVRAMPGATAGAVQGVVARARAAGLRRIRTVILR